MEKKDQINVTAYQSIDRSIINKKLILKTISS